MIINEWSRSQMMQNNWGGEGGGGKSVFSCGQGFIGKHCFVDLEHCSNKLGKKKIKIFKVFLKIDIFWTKKT